MKESPTGRSPREPEQQRLPPRTQEARDIVAAFRKSHQPTIDLLDIDYAKLELLVLANLTEEEKAKLEKEIYGKAKED
jgi:DNA polymerase I-like protein with 3'-5' exonuclease and polymerase domains